MGTKIWQGQFKTVEPAASYIMCYCYGNKGHYARDCPEAGSAKCKYCRKNGHLEKACKRKKEKEASGADDEASFFHGDFRCGVVEFADSDSHHGLQRQHSHDALQIGGEALVIASLSTSPTTFLANSGASHHICHDRYFFCKLSPFQGHFKVNQVQGSIDVTHSGTVMLEVDLATGK